MINKICFVYWLIKACDEWDTNLLCSFTRFNDQIATTKEWTVNIYCQYGISKASYSYN